MSEHIRDDILTILNYKVDKSNTSEYILGRSTCSSVEVAYLFFVLSRKYNVDIDILCGALDDYLTIDKLALLLYVNGEEKSD